MPTYAFTDFEHAVDRLHAVCDGWAAGGPYVDLLGDDGLHVLRLTLHEWIANLVQHAAYDGDQEILLTIGVDGDAVRCVVEDTSNGFDFARQIQRQQQILDAPAPSERGRGLLMLVTCAEELEFRPATETARQRLAFALRDPAGGDLGTLFRAADLQSDPALVHSMGDGQAGRPAPSPRQDR
ncbi:ATP-binding protein [Rubrivirga sp. IMCC45206]|uniref:ATP-binding protein n=1 Tax=Rubrivirga sp. IMCC45206 TaxID=3391614 RepID=UPI00398FA420